MRLATLFCGLALLLMTCGSSDAPPRDTGSAEPERLYPRFGDADPHPWDGRAPQTYPVHGVDVSRWQDPLDWDRARAAGISFAFIKATEGIEDTDPMFETHWQGAGSAGVRRGAYHYFYFCAPAAAQARWFIRNVPRGGELPPVLDMEWNHRSPTCRRRPDGATVRAEARAFLDILESHYGQRPIVYTTVDFWRDTGIGQLPRTRFWLRSVAGHPESVFPGADWDFWQYTGTGLVPGASGPIDINVFQGTATAWRSYPRGSGD